MRALKPGGSEYSLKAYGSMIADTVRMAAYRNALARVIEPGAVVLDVGAGTGVMALLACQLGAARVHAVEPSDALAVGVELARHNGFGDRIRFHPMSSLDLTLEAPADVLVSDLRGVLPLHGLHIPSIVDARARLLKPGGAQIPTRDTVHCQLVAEPGLHADHLAPWREPLFGLDLSPALRWAAHRSHKVDLSRSPRLGAPQAAFALDYRTIESPNARGTVRWRIDADATAHGVGAWFETELIDGVGFSNAPDRPSAIYGQMLFPLAEPLALRAGDEVAVTLAATLVGLDYVWQWDVAVAGGKHSRQSTFEAAPVNPARLAARAGSRVPGLSDEGAVAARALQLMGEQLAVADIARKLEAEFPALAVGRAGRLRELVGELSEWYAK